MSTSPMTIARSAPTFAALPKFGTYLEASPSASMRMNAPSSAPQ